MYLTGAGTGWTQDIHNIGVLFYFFISFSLNDAGQEAVTLSNSSTQKAKEEEILYTFSFLPAKQLESAEKWKNVQSSLADNKEEGTAISHGFYLHLWYCIMHCVGSSLYAHTLSIIEYNRLTRCKHIWGKNTKITFFIVASVVRGGKSNVIKYNIMFCKYEITYDSVPEAHTVLYLSSSWALLKTLSETIHLICSDNHLTIACQLMTHTKLWFTGRDLTL